MSYQQNIEPVRVDAHEDLETSEASHTHVGHAHTSYSTGYARQTLQVQRVVWFILGILETVLGLRFLLRLIGANPNAGFAQFIYNLSYPFLIPFFNLVPTPATEGVVLEVSTLIAMLVYALLFFFIGRGIRLVMNRRTV